MEDDQDDECPENFAKSYGGIMLKSKHNCHLASLTMERTSNPLNSFL